MSSNIATALSTGANDVQLANKNNRLREQVLRRLMKVGCACIPDLVNELDLATTAKDIEPVIKGLLDDGLIRRLVDADDPREYVDTRTVYELTR